MFNQDQLESLITKTIVGASALTMAKVGVNLQSWTTDVTDLVALVFAIGTFIWSHRYNKTTPAPAAKP